MKNFPLRVTAVLIILLVAVVLVIPSVVQKNLKITDRTIEKLRKEEVSGEVLASLAEIKDQVFSPEELAEKLKEVIDKDTLEKLVSKDKDYAIKEPVWPHKEIILGLDLQGGMHLALQVETDKAILNRVDNLVGELKSALREEKIKYTSLGAVKGKISLKIRKEKLAEYDKLMEDQFREMKILSRNETVDPVEIFMDLPDEEVDSIREWAVDQALETIRNRIDEFGVVEPDIRVQGDDRILIQLPGIRNTERAKNIITKVALLEFKLLDEDNDPGEAVETGRVPAGDQLLFMVKRDENTGKETKTPFLLKKRTLLTGEHLTDARVQIDTQQNEPYVSINFDRRGGKKFAKITEENVKKRLAIVLDNKVYSAPVIQEKIPGGRAQVTGNFTLDEAHDLAIALRAGALPAPVKFLEERSVGASLGEDSIKQGTLSMIIGGILVIIFMVIYYKGAGLIANIALVANILLVLGCLAAVQATLTLPGIAGMILTIGMAVDANVLIFERIREETALGKTPYAAVSAGYNRATLTILDANVTTLIAALVLGQFGTGPVRGFAVTLSFGVLSSLFTALILTRLFFDYMLLNRKMKALSI